MVRINLTHSTNLQAASAAIYSVYTPYEAENSSEGSVLGRTRLEPTSFKGGIDGTVPVAFGVEKNPRSKPF